MASLILFAATGASIAAQFPAEVELSELLETNGGDGTSGVIFAGSVAGDQAATSIRAAGDLNGDGIGDAIVGARLADAGGRTDAGETYIVFGRSTGFPATLDLSSLLAANGGDGTAGFVLRGVDSFDLSGVAAAGIGDVDGDGIDDLLVGASFADPDGRSNAGEGYVVFGSDAGFPAELELSSLMSMNGGDGSAGFVLQGIAPDDQAGSTVAGAGDINGDSFADFAISAPRADADGVADAGQVYVVFGRDSGFPADFPLAALLEANGGDGSEGFVVSGISAQDRAGSGLAGGGDVDGDGLADLVIGASQADPDGRTSAGQSYVLFGSTDPFPAQIALASLLGGNGGDGSLGFVLNGIDPFDEAGSVGIAGDFDNDGIDDLLIGAAKGDPGGRSRAGESYLVFGAATFPPEVELASLLEANGGDGSAGVVINGVEAGDEAGFSLEAAGDVNGDFIDDIIIGARLASPGARAGAGASYVLFGSDAASPPVIELSALLADADGDGTLGFALNGIAAGDESGRQVGAAGDVSGDGIDDVLIGALLADPDARVNAGEAVVVFGRPQVGAEISGVNINNVACRNVSLGLDVAGVLPEVELLNRWTCERFGLDVRAGDDVVVQATGVNFGVELAGTARGFVPGNTVRCVNDTTAEQVTTPPLEAGGAFDCAALGLMLSNRDQVTTVLRGTASFGRPRLAIATIRGLEARTGICRNLESGATAQVGFPELRLSEALDCEVAGVPAQPDDRMRIQFSGLNFGAALDGTLEGFSPGTVVTCRNDTVAEEVSVTVDDSLTWDCAAEMLPLNTRDSVTVTVAGRAAP